MAEYLDIMNEDLQWIGVADRKEVHQKGYWHQTFHCWVLRKEEDKTYLLFQKRHPTKDTFPNKLDISAAGHLLQGETVEDGIRELEEELGITVHYSELTFLGTYKGSYLTASYQDREFNQIHLLKTERKLADFCIQQTELKGLYQIEWESCRALLQGKQSWAEASGFEYDDDGQKEEKQIIVARSDFADQGDKYYAFVFDAMDKLK